MALSRVKTVLFVFIVLNIVTFVIIQQSVLLKKKRVIKDVLNTPRPEAGDPLNTPTTKVRNPPNTLKPKATFLKVTSVPNSLKSMVEVATNIDMPNMGRISNMSALKARKWFYLTEEKETKWKRCKRLIAGEEKLNTISVPSTDSEILDIYKPDQDCGHVLQARFGHPPVTKEEKQMPIAYGFTIHKGARLFERILQAVYMPNNVYCIHIDKKSPEVFHRIIQAMIRCLPNVFISKNSADVVWGHFSVVQAQINCMEALLQSPVKWKYYVSLTGQDFPLYDNKQIVQALKSLNNSNSIVSVTMPKSYQTRTKFVHYFKNKKIVIGGPKPPPPHNISIHKGSTHIIAIREFVNFVLHSEVGKDFVEFLKDTLVPDESLYASLQQYPLAPGGIHGEQPEWIGRALYWLLDNTRNICRGRWVRELCWVTFEDLQWTLGEDKKYKLFVHKIPFNFNDELIECILVARHGRKYGTSLWKQEKK